MRNEPRLPVIVGVGQHTQREVDPSTDPARLIGRAVAAALDDAGIARSTPVDHITVVNQLSWRHSDPARLVAEDLGLTVGRTAGTVASGNIPQSVALHQAAEIAAGRVDLAIVAGGEVWRSRTRARRDGVELAWRRTGTQPDELLGDTTPLTSPEELSRGLVLPVTIYPMFESALRASLGRSIEDHQVVISELYARFSEVAAGNPHAWSRTARRAEEIRTPSASNRMIGLPYPKLMNSNNDVDMAAAFVICSVERARALGIDESRWIHLHGGAEAHDTYFISNRRWLGEAPAIAMAGQRTLADHGLSPDDLDLVDLYSCFPVAVELGAAALGLPLDRPLTVTGGLQFNGGPWNNYVGHAICTMVERLRERPGATGLVWANGGYLTKHAFGIYSTEPPAGGFRRTDVQAEVDALGERDLAAVPEAAGPATIEAYTVMHGRDGAPERAWAACTTADGRRAWGTSPVPEVAAAMCEGEWVGRTVRLDGEGALLV